MELLNKDKVTVLEIKICCKVSEEKGVSVHNKRPTHGIVLFLKGESKFIFNKKKTVNVKAEQIIYLPEGSDYTSEDSDDAVCIAVNFLVAEDGDIFPITLLDRRYCEKYIPKFNKLLHYWEEGSTAYQSGCMALLYDIIFNMKRDIKTDYVSANQSSIMEQAILFINANIKDEFLTVATVAKSVGVTSEYLRRLFKAFKNMSTKEYIQLKRMEMAKDYLESGEIKLSFIPYECGFSDYTYFSKSYKKHFGISPKNYLQQLHQKNIN